MRLFHYTFEKNLESIRQEGLRPSIYQGTEPKPKQHENGHYLSDLSPEIAEKFTREVVYQSMFSQAGKWDDKLMKIAFVEFSLPEMGLKRVRYLYESVLQEQHPQLGIWLFPSEDILTAHYIQSWGRISFLEK